MPNELKAIAERVEAHYASAFRPSGAWISVGGGHLGGMFPFTPAYHGLSVSLLWLPGNKGFDTQVIAREFHAYKTAPLTRRVTRLSDSSHLEAAVREQLEQWLEEQPWRRGKAPKQPRQRRTWRGLNWQMAGAGCGGGAACWILPAFAVSWVLGSPAARRHVRYVRYERAVH